MLPSHIDTIPDPNSYIVKASDPNPRDVPYDGSKCDTGNPSTITFLEIVGLDIVMSLVAGLPAFNLRRLRSGLKLGLIGIHK